ncbi:MAG: hypothetical protein D6759_18600 [Chloroflexi bacterium]|nr:MAG: hypothetical protein D6759_18600 [Chloroflexota bacterium]
MGLVRSSSRTVAERLKALAEVYEHGQASEVIDRTLDKLLAHEAEVTRAQLQQLRADLARFEERYGLSSEEFYRRFQAGETDDRMDYVEWASLVQMVHNLEKRLRLLVGEDSE